MTRKKPSFVVAHPVEHGFRVIETTPREGAMKIARDALNAARAEPGLREAVAALEHEQWEKWSREVAATGLTPERIARWQRFWVPYEQLDEATKEFDRVWADRVLALAAAPKPALDRPVFTSEELGAMTVAERTAYVHDRAVIAEAKLPLDVKRLARAIRTIGPRDPTVTSPVRQTEVADLIAAEYERLGGEGT